MQNSDDMSRVVKIEEESLVFDDGFKLSSEHITECCEVHYLGFDDIDISDFDGLEFDLTNDDFFERIEGYGIALKPKNGFPVRIPGYGFNNGWYSSDLTLILTNGREGRTYDITDCQVIKG